MPVPAYMWLKDDDGANMKGLVDIQEHKILIECFCKVTKSALCHHYVITTQSILIKYICRVLN